ncbi:Kelch repeat-containing protein [Inhella proteolytica]|uniref:Uncharacterized protein n=1 Tax=Inhella proteolytica TaxID=2795029 RepID=A0A931J081_9BURK|nr:kelch repeat-containing protein [Inhella proteolytica]MBH9577059.1 hypothetical protein [Inhella proteolytica]
MSLPIWTRRRLLSAGFGGLSLTTLAACGGGGGGSGNPPAPAPPDYRPVAQPFPLSLHSAVALDARSVAVVGGSRGQPSFSASVDLFDTEAQQWRMGASLSTGRSQSQVLALDAQRLFVHGGARSLSGSRTAEWVDLGRGTSQPALASPSRLAHTATRLRDGRLLVAGGSSSEGYFGGVSPTLELWDPQTGQWRFAARPLQQPRQGHSATLLGDGRVLFVGGFTGTGMAASAELWDPATETSQLFSDPALGRAGHAAQLLPSGDLLLAGGETGATPQAPNPGVLLLRREPWRVEALAPALPSLAAASAITPGGALLLFGGVDPSGQAVAAALQAGPGVRALPPLPSPREWLSATALPSGRVLLLGGENRGALATSGLLFG